MQWMIETCSSGKIWHGNSPEGTWKIHETSDGCIGIPPSGQFYPYPIVAGLFQKDRSLAAAKILAQEASLWAAAAYPNAAPTPEAMDGFTIICAGEPVTLTHCDGGWRMSYQQDGEKVDMDADDPSDLIAILQEIFGQRSMEVRQAFSQEQDRSRKRSILAEKHAEAAEESSVVKRIMSRANNTASSRLKSVEYAFRSLRQLELRQMGLSHRARIVPMAAM